VLDFHGLVTLPLASVVTYNLTTGEELNNDFTKSVRDILRGIGRKMHGFAFHPDGRRMAVSLSKKKIGVWDVASGKRLI